MMPSVSVFESATIKSLLKRRKKRKCRNESNFYISLHLKDGFRNGIRIMLKHADARGSADMMTSLTVCDAYRYFVCQAKLLT